MGMGRTALPFFAEEGKDFGEGVVLSSGLGISVAADQATEGTPQRTKVPHTARADFALLAYQRTAVAPSRAGYQPHASRSTGSQARP